MPDRTVATRCHLSMPSQILLLLLPGLAVPPLALLLAPVSAGPQETSLAAEWSEPGAAGQFPHWKQRDGSLYGWSAHAPHKDERANAFLRSAQPIEGDVTVSADVLFARGRYLGCYLAYDPETDSGYWLSTGHHVGKYPGKAYVKRIDQGKWETQARADVAIEPRTEYHVEYRKRGATLSVWVDGHEVVSWADPDATYDAGRVQLRLHNTSARLRNLNVTTHGR